MLDVPPLGMSALTWGLFMGASSNLRYQAVFGLERVVDKTIARRVPQARPFQEHRCSFSLNVGRRCIDVIAIVANDPQPGTNFCRVHNSVYSVSGYPLHQFHRQCFRMSIEHFRTGSIWLESARLH